MSANVRFIHVKKSDLDRFYEFVKDKEVTQVESIYKCDNTLFFVTDDITQIDNFEKIQYNNNRNKIEEEDNPFLNSVDFEFSF